MIVAAMLDAGLDENFLKDQLKTLGLKDLQIQITETKRAGIRAIKFTPTAKEDQPPRGIKVITEIIEKSKITPRAKRTAIEIFNKLAHAEAAVHGKYPAEIHFHEVGAVDSIADIVSAAIGLDALAIEKVYCSTLSVGGGTVKCAHGILPVPAPATAELLKGVPIAAGPIQKELLTPTAAAILTTITDQFTTLPPMKIEKTGYGAGTLESDDFPNVLRLILGQKIDEAAENADSVCLLETNIDDITGELVGFVSQKLFETGALDVFTTPIYMKSNRSAVTLSVICNVADIQKMENLIFQEGLTFGIRKQILDRTKLAREFVTVATKFGEIKIKMGLLDGKVVTAKPEFTDCTTAANKHNVPTKTILEAAIIAYKNI